MSNRNSIFIEDAEIISHTAYAGDQFILRVSSPKIARRAKPGSFAHISCSKELPMRRPLSIMMVHGDHVNFLYKIVGEGTRLLAQREVGESISIMGPIGAPFTVSASCRRPLLIGGGVGIPPMVFLAQSLKASGLSGVNSSEMNLSDPNLSVVTNSLVKNIQPFVIMGSETPFPFQVQPSKIVVPSMPDGVIAAMPLLEDWGIASRLTSLQGYVGCYEGYVTDLARHWLQGLSKQQRNEVAVFSCGPHPMLESVARLANEFNLPCQVSLEEFMACAVGGCAGCVVEVKTKEGIEMKRVCVDGPVFEASQVF
ncbi:MAG: dihydroorotate dehydrogenase electron transfer subunit [Gammaproteobacteria bacterium]|nr:dihydroorotate dehydrogenase electron transfer subunit [Gammaproteobacteria bacterium]